MSDVLVEVSSRRFAVPYECPCCGAVPDAELVVPLSGPSAARSSAKAIDLPSCKRCNAHISAAEAAGMPATAIMLLGIVATIVTTITAGFVGLLAFPLALVAAFVVLTRRKRAAELARGPACARALRSVAYLGWSGSKTSVTLASPTYAARFAEQNAAILVEPTPRLRALLEGLARARREVPSIAADVATAPLTLAGWIEKLGDATGPAGRRHVLTRAFAELTDDASRHELVAAATAIDLAPIDKAVDAGGSLEERARILAEAIARITADNLPSLVQDAELRALEARLNSLR